ncbi:ribonuclease domain-containing protein [Kutzneria sp. CA-103260]|uniref:ribonuclease domain-containing protein n=1 Tax=Kutzneria sp. CA-103260 TaxID=2802641 RepID=UPI001BAC5C05|nr:ribonuclease domain-containing protein [Kutzneria sp. CA-103260]QUQ65940.1 guanyl-specific ribonuclease Sa [Kutzneria sp. CA-103260]
MSRTVKALLALVFAVVGVTTAATPALASPVAAHSVLASCGDTSGYQHVALSSLPAQAADTVKLIDQGGPFPYPGKDGSVFTNVEQILPICAKSYYHEYTVPTPGAPNRGARRIVTGEGGEFFWTGDHYATFQLINRDS